MKTAPASAEDRNECLVDMIVDLMPNIVESDSRGWLVITALATSPGFLGGDIS